MVTTARIANKLNFTADLVVLGVLPLTIAKLFLITRVTRDNASLAILSAAVKLVALVAFPLRTDFKHLLELLTNPLARFLTGNTVNDWIRIHAEEPDVLVLL